MLNRLKSLFHRETVFCVSAVLAVLSMFLVPPDGGYLRYPDYRTLALLFCLMTIVAGFRSLGVCASRNCRVSGAATRGRAGISRIPGHGRWKTPFSRTRPQEDPGFPDTAAGTSRIPGRALLAVRECPDF